MCVYGVSLVVLEPTAIITGSVGLKPLLLIAYFFVVVPLTF